MTWGMRLAGHEFDLTDWFEMLQPPFDPWVELIMKDEEKWFVLFSSSFEPCLSSTEVREASIPLLRKLNALALIERGCDAVTSDQVVQKDANGEFKSNYYSAVASARIRVRAGAVAVVIRTATGEVVNQPRLRSFPQAALGSANPTLHSALEHYSRADNWHDLFKAFEAIEDVCKGRKKIPVWCSVAWDDVNDFAQNAQLVRHHTTPANPARIWSFEEARAFVGKLLKALLSP